ncbi:MAG: prepilin-type N-terminal cleavage/methylation domain-containing protein [Candidatus Paceibacterota bacterium]|jgi:prepilin-type N-terminal cleavage/methylation domain-containing protein
MRSHEGSKFKKGFTLTEIIIVLGILLLILGSSFPLAMDFYRNRQIGSHLNGLVQALRNAQMRSISGEGDSSFGVEISDGRYTLFKGDSYAGRDPVFDEITEIPQTISVEGLSEISFSKLRGKPSAVGTTTLTLGSKEGRIEIDETGKISYQEETINFNPVPATVELLAGSSASSWTASNAPYNTYYMDSIAQSIYLKSDLNAAGISGASTISEVCLQCSSLPGRDIANLRIKMKNTSASSLSSFDTAGLAVVYGPASYAKPSAGEWVCHALAAPFDWDGSSNLLVEVYRNDNAWVSGGGNYVRSTGSGRTYGGYCDDCTGCGTGGDCYSPSMRGSFAHVESLKITYMPSD